MKMIEKVAIAIAAWTYSGVKWDDCNDKVKEEWKMCAKAAIEAMREPTDEMLTAFYGTTPKEQWLGKDWQDMIDAALNE